MSGSKSVVLVGGPYSGKLRTIPRDHSTWKVWLRSPAMLYVTDPDAEILSEVHTETFTYRTFFNTPFMVPDTWSDKEAAKRLAPIIGDGEYSHMSYPELGSEIETRGYAFDD